MNRKSSSAEMEKLENMKIVELREYAKNLGLKGVSKLKKQELIEAVSDFIENEKSGKTEEVKNSSEASNQALQKNNVSEKEPQNNSRPGGENKNDKPAVQPVKNEVIEYSDPVRRTNLMSGVLEVLEDGYGFLRSDNYQSGPDDVYVPQAQIRRFRLKTGDYIVGNTRMQHEGEKYQALLYVQSVNGDKVDVSIRRKAFEDLTPIYPRERLKLETVKTDYSMRIIDLIAPVGKGQRGIIIAPPKAGKTTLLKNIADRKSVV